MVNNFGKFCRKLRIDNDELLYDMAEKLGVSSAFLSKVENGRKKPPKDWENLLIQKYDLNLVQTEELKKSIFEAQNYDSIDISEMEENDRIMMLSFARKFNQLDKKKIKDLLQKDGDVQ